jgi:hypothetical protein
MKIRHRGRRACKPVDNSIQIGGRFLSTQGAFEGNSKYRARNWDTLVPAAMIANGCAQCGLVFGPLVLSRFSQARSLRQTMNTAKLQEFRRRLLDMRARLVR